MDPTLEYLFSPFFTIILKNPKDTDVANDAANETNSGLPQERKFYVHRSMLASLSPELDKHVNNDMKEGLEGIMELNDVEEATMKALLEWAYTKNYTISNPTSASALLKHTTVYTLADRFNIATLKDLAYSRITKLLINLGKIKEAADIEALLAAITYAFDNLPCSTASSSDSIQAMPSEKLLTYFVQYSAWLLDVLKDRKEFSTLLLYCADFARAVLLVSRAAPAPPWAGDIGGNAEHVSVTVNGVSVNLQGQYASGQTSYQGSKTMTVTRRNLGKLLQKQEDYKRIYHYSAKHGSIIAS
ncbi:hypothetical protein BDZ91DRAFT_814660 [Kalaharituber pfeilii]|nr:hypothetical protein BDZ91DRAFT_814660 [Kalaharituber pfeilii]